MWFIADRSVQRTGWSSGVAVVVNFGGEPFRSGAVQVEPRDFAITK